MKSAYAPSLTLILEKKEEKPRKPRKNDSRSRPERLTGTERGEVKLMRSAKWICDFSDWMLEGNGIRTKKEIMARLASEGIDLKAFVARIAEYEWLVWERSQLKLLSLAECQSSDHTKELHEKASQIYERRPRCLGCWIKLEDIKTGDLIWGLIPYKNAPFYTRYLPALFDGQAPHHAAIIDGFVFKRLDKQKKS